MPSTARQLRQPPTIEAIGRVPYFADVRVNLSHLAHYTLSWIAYMDNIYNIYRALKDKNQKYPIRIY